MGRKELPRAGLVKAALAGRIPNRDGATALHLSVRQFQHLKRRVEAGGASALCHGSRGQPSPRRMPAKLGATIAALLTTTYAGFNDVHLTEKLREVHGLEVCRESVRRIRLGLGRPAKRPRRAPRHRRRREREAASGALIQVDGSPCAWLEARGPSLTLLGAIDDATGAILALRFRPHEDLHGYASLVRELCVTHGLPAGPLWRSPQRLRAQRSPLDPRRGIARHAAPHALWPYAPGPGRRLHRRPLAAGQGPH